MADIISDDAPEFSEYLSRTRGASLFFLYASIGIHAIAFATVSYMMSDSSFPTEGIYIASFGVLLAFFGVPIALWRDSKRVKQYADSPPRWYIYAVLSFFVGVVGVFALVFYVSLRKDAIRETYIDKYSVWEDSETDVDETD